MSKRAKEAALKAYPEKLEWDYRDMDYDPNMESRIAYRKGYEQAEKGTIERVIEWLKANAHKYSLWDTEECCLDYDETECINDFRKAMEEES